MSRVHLVNIWTDPEPGPGGFRPMAASMLWLPDGRAPGAPGPALVYAHRWGGYPHDPLARQLGPEFADRGFAFLSVCLRRRGMEGQLTSSPMDDIRDIKLAVDYLDTNGFHAIFLVGEEIGGHSILRYHAATKDLRVRGLALVNPIESRPAWLRSRIDADALERAIESASVAMRQGASMETRIDLEPCGGPFVTQKAGTFLSWWGEANVVQFERDVADTHVPVLLLPGNDDSVPDAFAKRADDARIEIDRVDPDSYADTVVRWADAHGAEHFEDTPIDVVQTQSRGVDLFGLLWRPASGRPTDTVIVLMHGLTSSPLSPLFGKMAPVLAQAESAVCAIESHRSGFRGHETAMLEDDVSALDAWVATLLEQGFTRIVLAGASMGSLSIGRFYSLRRHPNVVALAHLMPTADCPEWFRRAAGDEAYERAVATANEAVVSGRGADVLIDIDIRQPPPSLFQAPFRWTQKADSWLSWWGPDADSRNSDHIARADVPVLLLSGTDDSYNDEARFAELRAASVCAPSVEEIWYAGVDHGLAGAERRAARDLVAWLERVAVLGSVRDPS